jgi:hypothetical protein
LYLKERQQADNAGRWPWLRVDTPMIFFGMMMEKTLSCEDRHSCEQDGGTKEKRVQVLKFTRLSSAGERYSLEWKEASWKRNSGANGVNLELRAVRRSLTGFSHQIFKKKTKKISQSILFLTKHGLQIWTCVEKVRVGRTQ